MEISRKEIKRKSKEIIKHNFIDLCVSIIAIPIIVYLIINYLESYLPVSTSEFMTIVQIIVQIIISICVANVVLKVVREGKTSASNFFEPFQDNFVHKISVALWGKILIFLNYLLLIIPGIIKTLQYTMVKYILVDGEEKDVKDVLKESKELMNGHKVQYLAFMLSYFFEILILALIYRLMLIVMYPVSLLDLINNINVPELLTLIVLRVIPYAVLGYIYLKIHVATALFYQVIKGENILNENTPVQKNQNQVSGSLKEAMENKDLENN